SDGSATLRFLDPGSFAPVRTLAVTDGGKPVERLNELEVIDGTLWANILGSDRIALIDLASGEVRRWLDLRALRGKDFAWRRARDLNGIAHDPTSGHVYVTGKLWPALYELRVDGVADAPGQGGEVARCGAGAAAATFSWTGGASSCPSDPAPAPVISAAPAPCSGSARRAPRCGCCAEWPAITGCSPRAPGLPGSTNAATATPWCWPAAGST